MEFQQIASIKQTNDSSGEYNQNNSRHQQVLVTICHVTSSGGQTPGNKMHLLFSPIILSVVRGPGASASCGSN